MHKKLAATGVALLLGLATPGAGFAQTSGTGTTPGQPPQPTKPNRITNLVKPKRDLGAKHHQKPGPKHVQLRVKPPHFLLRVKPQRQVPTQKPVRENQTKPQRQQQTTKPTTQPTPQAP